MSGSSLYPVQKMIYDTLTGDAQLMSRVTGVFDFVPDNFDYPYVVIGRFNAGPFDTYVRMGQTLNPIIHVWSRREFPNQYQGMKQAELIMDDILRLLALQTIAIDDWYDVGIWFDYSDLMVEPDGITQHGIIRFRMLVQQM